MNDSVTISSRFGKVITIGTLLIALFALVITVIDGGVSDAVRYVWPLALIVYVVVLLFWLPSVTVADSGVTLRNVVRSIGIAWPAIQRIDTKFALTLFTAYGKFVAWSAPAPGLIGGSDASTRKRSASDPNVDARRPLLGPDPGKAALTIDYRHLPESTYQGGTVRAADHPGTDSGQAALLVRTRWEQLRGAGYLNDPRLEADKPQVTIHWLSLTILAALIAATVLALTLPS